MQPLCQVQFCKSLCLTFRKGVPKSQGPFVFRLTRSRLVALCLSIYSLCECLVLVLLWLSGEMDACVVSAFLEELVYESDEGVFAHVLFDLVAARGLECDTFVRVRRVSCVGCSVVYA